MDDKEVNKWTKRCLKEAKKHPTDWTRRMAEKLYKAGYRVAEEGGSHA